MDALATDEFVNKAVRLRLAYRDKTHGGYPSHWIISIDDFRLLRFHFKKMIQDDYAEPTTFLGIPFVLKHEGELEVGINPDHLLCF